MEMNFGVFCLELTIKELLKSDLVRVFVIILAVFTLLLSITRLVHRIVEERGIEKVLGYSRQCFVLKHCQG